MSEEAMDEFTSIYNLKSLIKKPTCFKSEKNPSCIDLILTNRVNCFQNSSTVETGLSDFHHLVLTVLKTTFRKKPPKKVLYGRPKDGSLGDTMRNMTSYRIIAKYGDILRSV